MSQPTINVVVERLAKLERANAGLQRERRRWRCTGIACLVGVGFLAIAGAAELSEPKSIEANEFVLRDKDGKMRASLTIRPDGAPGFALFDEKEKMRLSLDLGAKEKSDSDTPGVNIYGDEGELRAALTIRPDGTPGLGFFDKDRNPRLSLDMSHDDSTGVNIYGEGGALRAALAIRPDGTPGLGLFNTLGQVVQSIDLAPEGAPMQAKIR